MMVLPLPHARTPGGEMRRLSPRGIIFVPAGLRWLKKWSGGTVLKVRPASGYHKLTVDAYSQVNMRCGGAVPVLSFRYVMIT